MAPFLCVLCVVPESFGRPDLMRCLFPW
uniref:Uncharacterized protein n=1 Tax=Anguilla anguilla TaxID=7936 RepID=A0A0E9VZX8_ANGAN